jgi:hypothetical protein
MVFCRFLQDAGCKSFCKGFCKKGFVEVGLRFGFRGFGLCVGGFAVGIFSQL